MTYSAKAREIAQTAFKTFIDNIAVMVSCPRCDGVGHHHGFGEDGMDPDWCSKCGGNQSVEKYTDEEAFVLAIEQALTTIGNEREAIGYGKGKEEAKKERPTALARDIIGYCLENDVLTRAGLAGLEKRIEIALNPDVAKIYAALLHAANKRMDANSNSKQERELDLLADVIVAYEQEAFP